MKKSIKHLNILKSLLPLRSSVPKQKKTKCNPKQIPDGVKQVPW
jgi:hypothetical protein